MKPNSILQGDCLKLMRDLPHRSIPLVLTDLPYGMTYNDWDSAVPLTAFWDCIRYILTDTGTVVLTGSQPFTGALVCSNPSWFKVEWIWRKVAATGHLNVKKLPMKEHENVLVFQPGPLGSGCYNPQGINLHGRVKNRGTNGGSNYNGCGAINFQTHTGYPKSILEFKHDTPRYHPTQKPVALFEYLIRTYSNPGDLVLDPCSGSGTTGVAAIRSHRHYLLMDTDKSYCDTARSRIQSEIEKIKTPKE